MVYSASEAVLGHVLALHAIILLPSKSTFGSQIDSIDSGITPTHNFSTPGFGREDRPFLTHGVDAEV